MVSKIVENSDLVRCFGINVEMFRGETKNSGPLKKALGSLMFLPGVAMAYACCKHDKIRDRGFYEKFYWDRSDPMYINNRTK
jgi:hypothetical protein